MNSNQLLQFKTFFQDKKAEITLTTSKPSETLDSDIRDEMDLAQNITMLDISEKLILRNKAMLVRINKALEKINNGTFGECEYCEEEIGEARLKAMPDCRLCIVCAEREERVRKQYRSG